MINKRVFITQNNISVLDFLANKGIKVNSSCAGRGTCKLCSVKILSGNFIYNGKSVSINSCVPACKTFGQGVVEVTLKPQTSILDYWNNITISNVNKCVIGIDIGSTTIVAVKFSNGKILDVKKELNPQSVHGFGADVITRIAKSQDKENFEELCSLLNDCVDYLISSLDIKDVSAITIAGSNGNLVNFI